jgi:hypothetical protein
MVTAMAKVIEFYVPEKFRKQKQRGKWAPPEQRGKIIPFCTRNFRTGKEASMA